MLFTRERWYAPDAFMSDLPASDRSLSPLLKNALFWGLTQLPPITVGVASLAMKPEAVWDRIRQHPLVALAVFAIYEFAVFVLSLFKKVWANLEPKIIKGLTEWVESHQPFQGVNLSLARMRRRAVET